MQAWTELGCWGLPWAPVPLPSAQSAAMHTHAGSHGAHTDVLEHMHALVHTACSCPGFPGTKDPCLALDEVPCLGGPSVPSLFPFGPREQEAPGAEALGLLAPLQWQDLCLGSRRAHSHHSRAGKPVLDGLASSEAIFWGCLARGQIARGSRSLGLQEVGCIQDSQPADQGSQAP